MKLVSDRGGQTEAPGNRGPHPTPTQVIQIQNQPHLGKTTAAMLTMMTITKVQVMSMIRIGSNRIGILIPNGKATTRLAATHFTKVQNMKARVSALARISAIIHHNGMEAFQKSA